MNSRTDEDCMQCSIVLCADGQFDVLLVILKLKKITDIFYRGKTYKLLQGSMEDHYIKEGVWEIYYYGAFWMD